MHGQEPGAPRGQPQGLGDGQHPRDIPGISAWLHLEESPLSLCPAPGHVPIPCAADQRDTSHQQWGSPSGRGQPQGSGVGVHGAAPLGTPRGKGVRQGGSDPLGLGGVRGARQGARDMLSTAARHGPSCVYELSMGQHILGRGTAWPGRGGHGTSPGDSGAPSEGAGPVEWSTQERPGTHPTLGLKPAPAPQRGPHVSPRVPKAAKHSLAPSRGGGHQERAVTSSHLPAVTPGRVTSRRRCRGLLAPFSANHDLMEQIFQPRGAFPARGRDAAAASAGAGQGPSATPPCQRPPSPVPTSG